MSLSAMERFFSLLALLAAALAVLIVVLRLVPAGRPWLGHLAPAKRWLAFAIAGTAMAGSLYFSESQHFEPCKLCWYQRIAMFSTAIVLLVAAILALMLFVPDDDHSTTEPTLLEDTDV